MDDGGHRVALGPTGISQWICWWAVVKEGSRKSTLAVRAGAVGDRVLGGIAGGRHHLGGGSHPNIWSDASLYNG